MRPALIWAGLVLALALPLWLAAQSPLLQWRQPVYIAGGFAGIAGLALMLVQPLLAAGQLPVSNTTARRWHRRLGAFLVCAVLAHIAGLWITSPPDVIDVLLFRSPTPFGVWGALAMWAVFAAAALAALRKRLPLRPMTWRALHGIAVALAVAGTIAHALLIEGAMEQVSKWGLSLLAGCATSLAVWRVFARWRAAAR